MTWFAHLDTSFQQSKDKRWPTYPWQTACQHDCSICATNQLVTWVKIKERDCQSYTAKLETCTGARGDWSHYWIIIERTFLMTSVRIVLLVRKLWSADSAGWTGLKQPCIGDWRSAMHVIMWPTSSALCAIKGVAYTIWHTTVIIVHCIHCHFLWGIAQTAALLLL